jgi:hypothetical protein
MSKKFWVGCLMLFTLTALSYKISTAQSADKPGPSNLVQPAPVLSAADKAELTEALRLKAEFGDRVWPGLGGSVIPIILYNDSYEFLVGEENPTDSWEVVKEDNFMGRPYYRRAARNPQSFAVSIGTRWAGRIGTLDWMNSKGPFKITADFLIVGLLHEMFHAYQANLAPARFARATAVYASEGRYPYKDSDFASAWNSEGKTLAEAIRAKDDAEAGSLAQKFLHIRDARRKQATLSPDLVAYEVELEWLEGLAEYVEIKFYELAASSAREAASIRYGPGLPFYLQGDFIRLERQLGQQSGDLRFYLSGMAQARLLDRLNPGWKAKAMQEKVYLEDLLRAIVEPEKNQLCLWSSR